MDALSQPQRCPTCSGPLSAGDSGGAWCPRCALAGAFEADEASPEASDAGGGLFRVAGHVVLAEIGRGAAGIVYRARQEQPAREVALKILRPHESGSAESLARFRLEAATVAALDHPVILPVLTVGEHDGLPYFTMKLCRGSLAERVADYRGRWRAVAELVARLAEAVQHAHARGVLHRDLKPGNVLFDEAERPFISDFGLAKVIEASTGVKAMTRPLLVMGTPGYVAPEVLAGGVVQATTAADVFALGAILHELLTGAPPPAGAAAAGAARMGVPRDLAVICAHALAAEPGKRYASAEALAEDLRAWLAGRPIAARPVSAWGRGWSWARRNPALAGVTALLVGSLIAGAVAVSQQNRVLRRALEQTRAAEATAQASLAESLVAQARAVRQSGWMGQRHDALALLARAGKINPGLAVRSEAAAALARPDLALERTLPAPMLNGVFDELDFSPDLAVWASGTKEGGLALRRSSDGSVIRVLAAESEGLPWFVRFGGDGVHVTAHFNDERMHVWNRETGARVFVTNGSATQPPRAALHPRVGRLAWVDGDGWLSERELAKGESRRLAKVGQNVRRLSYATDGKRIAVVTDDGLQVWDAEKASRVWQWAGSLARAEPAWSDRGDVLAVSQLRPEQEVVIFDVASGQVRQRLPANSSSVCRLAFFPGGHVLAAMEVVGELTLWEWSNRERLLSARSGRGVLRVAPDGRRLGLAVSFQELGLMKVADDGVLRPWRRGEASAYTTHALAFSRDGRRAVSADRATVRLWDVARGAEAASLVFPAAVREATDISVVFEPSGEAVLLALDGGAVHRWSVADGRAEGLRAVGRGGGYQLREFVGDDLFVDANKAGRMERWRKGDPGLVEPATGPAVGAGEEWDTSMVSGDGRWVVTAPLQSGQLQIWDAAAAKVVGGLPVEGRVGGSFSPDGRWLVLGNVHGYRLVAATSWQVRETWPARLVDEYRGWSAFSPDGRWLALLVGNRTIELRETVNSRPVIRLELTRGPARNEQAWSADSTRFCIASKGQQIYEWNLPALERELKALGVGALGATEPTR